MALPVTEIFAAKYTLRATVTSSAIPDTGIVNVPAELEDYWLKRLGYTIGTPETKAIRTLQEDGLLDAITITKLAATTWDAYLSDAVDYDPSLPAGERIRFYLAVFGSGSAGANFIFFTKLPHSIQH